MKWDEGGMENVWRWRVSWFMSRARERVGCVAKAVSNQAWRMRNGCMDNPLIWVWSSNDFRNCKLLLQEVERDFTEVEVFPQLRIRE